MEYRSAAGAASDDRLPHLPLIRCPAVGKLAGVVTTHRIVELWTHFHRGRTIGCAGDACVCRTQQVAMRYEAYFGLYNPTTKTHAIVGTTVGAIRCVLEQLSRLDRMRGQVLEIGRASKRPNSKVQIKCGLIWSDCSALPAPFDVIPHLEKIWGVEHAEDVKAVDRLQQLVRDRETLTDAEGRPIVEADKWSRVVKTPNDLLDDQTHLPGVE